MLTITLEGQSTSRKHAEPEGHDGERNSTHPPRDVLKPVEPDGVVSIGVLTRPRGAEVTEVLHFIQVQPNIGVPRKRHVVEPHSVRVQARCVGEQTSDKRQRKEGDGKNGKGRLRVGEKRGDKSAI